MKYCRFLLILGLLTLPSLYLYAGDATVDLGISVSVTPAGDLPPGSEGVVSISITNYGPDSGRAALQLLQTPDGVGTSWPPLVFTEWFDGPCSISPIAQPGPGQTFPNWMTGELAAGEKVVCSFGFVVADTAVTEQLAQWRVSAGAGGQNDPNPDNNTSEVLLRFARQTEALPVPVFSWLGMLLLIVLLLFISMRRL
jgi:hypothetical protein